MSEPSYLKPFHWTNHTHVAFGVGAMKHLTAYLPKRSKVLCIYDGDHVNQSGVRRDLETVLDASGASYSWRKGIEPNPDYASCLSIINECRKSPVDYLIAVGGGSVMDATKYIASCINLPSAIDPWSVMLNGVPSGTKTVPAFSVCTLAATGSEWNDRFMISKRDILYKIGQNNPAANFKLSVLDPRYTLTVPKNQTANGLFDSFTHVCEQYITGAKAPMQDGMSEAVLRTIVDTAPKLMENLTNLECRGAAMQSSAIALNHILSMGTRVCWGTHRIGCVLTAKYGMDHGATLVTILPWLWRHYFDVKKHKLAQMAVNVWGSRTYGSVEELARYSIERTEEYARMLGYPLRIQDYSGVKGTEAELDTLTDLLWEQLGKAPFGEGRMITKEDARAIMAKAY